MASEVPAGQADSDEAVPSHLECAICMKLLLEPVSVPCGHTFCQRCLEQSLGYRNLCAICRSPVPAGQAVNIIIRSMIADQYPKALASRRRELEEEFLVAETSAVEERHREVQGAEVNEQQTGEPTFVLPVLRHGRSVLPFGRLDLDLTTQEEHVANYALQGGRRICVLLPGADLGLCMNVENLQPSMATGAHMRPAHVVLVGKFRTRLAEPPQMHEDGFELCKCQALFDTPLPMKELLLTENAEVSEVTPDGSEGTAEDQVSAAALGSEAMEFIERQLQSLGEGTRYVFQGHCGEPPSVMRSRQPITSPGLEHLSFWLLGAIVMEDAQRRRWLESTDTRGRLADCHARLAAAGRRSVLNLPGADSWMHPGQSSLSSLFLLLAIIAAMVAKALGYFN